MTNSDLPRELREMPLVMGRGDSLSSGTEVAHVELGIPSLTELGNSVGTEAMGGGGGTVEVTVRGGAVEDALCKRDAKFGKPVAAADDCDTAEGATAACSVLLAKESPGENCSPLN